MEKYSLVNNRRKRQKKDTDSIDTDINVHLEIWTTMPITHKYTRPPIVKPINATDTLEQISQSSSQYQNLLPPLIAALIISENSKEGYCHLTLTTRNTLCLSLHGEWKVDSIPILFKVCSGSKFKSIKQSCFTDAVKQ